LSCLRIATHYWTQAVQGPLSRVPPSSRSPVPVSFYVYVEHCQCALFVLLYLLVGRGQVQLSPPTAHSSQARRCRSASNSLQCLQRCQHVNAGARCRTTSAQLAPSAGLVCIVVQERLQFVQSSMQGPGEAHVPDELTSAPLPGSVCPALLNFRPLPFVLRLPPRRGQVPPAPSRRARRSLHSSLFVHSDGTDTCAGGPRMFGGRRGLSSKDVERG
jgi:hypothetical protein